MYKTYESTYVYHIDYIDFTIEWGKKVGMNDSFSLDGYRLMIQDAQRGEVHINRVDVNDPMNPNEYTTIFENPIQMTEN